NEKVAVSILFCSSGLAQSTGAHFASIRTPSPLGRRDHPGGNFFAGARNPQATVCPVLDSDQASRFRNPDARHETREIGSAPGVSIPKTQHTAEQTAAA